MRLGSLAALTTLVVSMGTGGVVLAQTTPTSAQLEWTAPGDDGMTGTASQYDLRYSTSAITSANFGSATRWLTTPAPGVSGSLQNTTITGLLPNTTYWFAMKAADEVPNWSVMSNVVQFTTPTVDPTRPAMVTTLAVNSSTETTASLGWTAVGDDSLTGTATSYDIRYSTSPITTANWASATQAPGEPAPTAAGTTQSFSLTGLTRQTTYYVAMTVADEGGNVSALSNVASFTTPDQTRPAAINDLAVGFIWVSAGGPNGTHRATN